MKDKQVKSFSDILSMQKTKLLFGSYVLLGGIGLFLMGDTLTYFPILFFVTGIYILLMSLFKIRNLIFYLITFLPVYYIVSMYYEVTLKRYQLEVILPDHKNEFLFVLSNTKLKWIDYPLTWFTSNTIKADLTGTSIIYLTRGKPYNMRLDYEALNKQGYSIYNKRNHIYDFTVFVPLISNDNYNSIEKNNELQMKIINKKIDSLEKL